MYSGLYRPSHKKSRRFLYEKEVQQILECPENEKRKVIATLPIHDKYRASIAKASDLKETLSRLLVFGAGVCRIEVSQPNGPGYIGSGFYFGNGWVLTAAHVLRNRENVNNARFVFFSPNHEIAFELRPRRAIIHRLLPVGRRPDYHNRDITLVKLGMSVVKLILSMALWQSGKVHNIRCHRLRCRNYLFFLSLMQRAICDSKSLAFSRSLFL